MYAVENQSWRLASDPMDGHGLTSSNVAVGNRKIDLGFDRPVIEGDHRLPAITSPHCEVFAQTMLIKMNHRDNDTRTEIRVCAYTHTTHAKFDQSVSVLAPLRLHPLHAEQVFHQLHYHSRRH